MTGITGYYWRGIVEAAESSQLVSRVQRVSPRAKQQQLSSQLPAASSNQRAATCATCVVVALISLSKLSLALPY